MDSLLKILLALLVPVALLLSNSITFTPGTLTVELTEDPRVIYVHVLHFTTVEAITEEVRLLERLISAALVKE